MLIYLYVAIGGAVGSLARFAVAGAVASGLDEVFPWGTFVVNVTGCFAIGLFAALTGPHDRLPLSQDIRAFVMIGLCGGYTTFSSFSLQTLALARDGHMTRAGLNVVGSVLFCLLGVWLGARAGIAISQAKGA